MNESDYRNWRGRCPGLRLRRVLVHTRNRLDRLKGDRNYINDDMRQQVHLALPDWFLRGQEVSFEDLVQMCIAMFNTADDGYITETEAMEHPEQFHIFPFLFGPEGIPVGIPAPAPALAPVGIPVLVP
jgi:hypothetical protein